MSSKKESALLIPGPDGWEIWQGDRQGGYRRTLENGPMLASAVEGIPSGPLLMAFPARQALALPLNVQTEDTAMFEDLAEMHLEKSGIRPELGAGRLNDVFPAGHGDGRATLLSVVLSAPKADELPMCAPGKFDISARFFPMEANAVTLWRELGRWVFAITSGGHLTYFQSLSCSKLGGNTVRDIRLALAQLGLQGVNLNMDKAVIWSCGHNSDASEEEIQAFAADLEAEVGVEPKPRPVLPDPMSRIVPADIRVEQRFKQEKQKRNRIVVAMLLVYLAVVGYFAYDYFKLDSDLAIQQDKLDKLKVKHMQISLFDADWDQLAPVVDSKRWPLQLLYRTATVIPPAQDLRFKLFEASRERIVIRGETADLKVADNYAQKIRRSLPEYEWTIPPPKPDKKTDRWLFDYEGILKGEDTK